MEVAYARFLRRFLNMRSKEFISFVKAEIKSTKSKALREALTKKKTKGKASATSKATINDICEDKTDGKLACHLKLKALVLEGKEVLATSSKVQLHFLFLLYGEKFLKSKKKKVLSELLCNAISMKQAMPHPSLANQRCYSLIETIHAQGKTMDTSDAYSSLGLVAPQNSTVSVDPRADTNNSGLVPIPMEVSNLQEPSRIGNAIQNEPEKSFERLESAEHAATRTDVDTRKERLKRFKPSAAQISILLKDNTENSGKVPKAVISQRAEEFLVEPSQIRRWHLLCNKRGQK